MFRKLGDLGQVNFLTLVSIKLLGVLYESILEKGRSANRWTLKDWGLQLLLVLEGYRTTFNIDGTFGTSFSIQRSGLRADHSDILPVTCVWASWFLDGIFIGYFKRVLLVESACSLHLGT